MKGEAMRFKAFIQRFQTEYLTRVLKETFLRFPLSVLCCIAGTVLCILNAHDIKPFSDDILARISLFLCDGLVLFTAARLFAEGAKLSAAETAGVLAVCIALVAGAA